METMTTSIKRQILKRTFRTTTKNRLYDVYQFRQAKQGNAETLDQYYTRLRTLSKRCNFADADFEIMRQIVLYGTSSRLRKQALRETKMTLHQDLLPTGSQLERSNVEARHIEEDRYAGTSLER